MTGQPSDETRAAVLAEIGDDVQTVLDEIAHHMHLRPGAEQQCTVCTARDRLTEYLTARHRADQAQDMGEPF